MTSLPNELFHLIIAYLAKDQFDPLLKFRTICRDWKEIADHSTIWLKCRLIICPPKVYRELFPPWQNEEICHSLHEEITSLRRYPPISLIREDISSPIHSQERLHSSNTTPTTLEPFNEAYTISTAFLKYYRIYNHAWRRFLSIYHIFNTFEVFFEKISPILVLICFCLNTLILIATILLISSITDYPTSLTIKEKIAFICIYWNLSSYLLSFLFHFVRVFADDLRCEIDLNILKPYTVLQQPRYADAYLIILFTLALLATFALLQCSLSSYRSVIKYSYIILPIFCAIIVGLIILIVMRPFKTKFRIGFIVFLIPTSLSIFLVGLYYDQPSSSGVSSLSMAFIPLYPLLFLLFAASLYNIRKTIILWGNWIRGHKICKDQGFNYFGITIFTRLSIDLIVIGSVVLMFLVLLNLIYESFQGSLSLSTSLVSVLIFFLLIKVFLVCFNHDNFYL